MPGSIWGAPSPARCSSRHRPDTGRWGWIKEWVARGPGRLRVDRPGPRTTTGEWRPADWRWSTCWWFGVRARGERSLTSAPLCAGRPHAGSGSGGAGQAV
jgi:hypothetical protein